MKGLKVNISILILLFINFIFTYKYTSRYTDLGIYISIVLLISQILVYKQCAKINLSNKLINIIYFGFISFIIGLVIISHYGIPVETLNVDRWSVISSFLDELFNGNYPYYAKSHMGNHPGPMPTYFLISLPFYLIGELSILSSIGYFIIIFLIIKKIKSNQNSIFLLFYLLTSLYLIWEITTRSNIFTFTILILLVLNKFIDFKSTSNLKFIILAIISGFLLSTRSVFILAYIIFFLSSLINNEITFKKLSFFISIALLGFLTTFLPFVILFKNDFFIMNPFIIQSSFLVPKFYTFIFILISILLTFLVRNKSDKFFYSGISLFVSILIYSIYHIVNYGFEISFTKSKIDISYFIFCIPFLIMYLIKNNDKKKDKITIANNGYK